MHSHMCIIRYYLHTRKLLPNGVPPPISEVESIHACARIAQATHSGMLTTRSSHAGIAHHVSLALPPSPARKSVTPSRVAARAGVSLPLADVTPPKGRTNAVLNCPLSADMDKVSPVAAVDRLLRQHAAEPGQR